MDIILPFDNNLGYEIFDSNGKRINNIYYFDAKKGLNKIVLPTYYLSSGIYAVKITFNNNIIIKKFMKKN